MILLYFVIVVLFLLLISLIAKLVNRKRLFTSFIMLFVIVLVLAAGFILDSTKTRNVANAVEQIKYWFQSPIVKTNTFLQDNFDLSIIKIKDSILIDAPIVNQLPELPRGCEVTSLTMLLQFAGVEVDKMTLAEKIIKEPSTYRKENDVIYFGHPNDGFVGDMYSFHNPGLGVYHKPIKELADQYLPGRMIDLTGGDFQELKIHLSDNRPVWVITNTAYSRLPESKFQTWQTPNGPVKITYKEHSVLLTGYDSQYIYFNDPLTGVKNKKAPIKEFEDSWVQMGSQAITYLN
ncbi:C39 family peptidase [Niallia oryzisoli]|uniref:C39 family peptidase n=1 Tax=Niallia oryzisoli TaxID=1737571 RepID=UPI0037353AE8